MRLKTIWKKPPRYYNNKNKKNTESDPKIRDFHENFHLDTWLTLAQWKFGKADVGVVSATIGRAIL